MLIVIVLLRILLFWLFYFVPWTVFVNVWVYTCHTILASFDCGMFRELFAQAFIPAWFIFPSWFFCLSFLIVNKTRYLVFESTFFDFICTFFDFIWQKRGRLGDVGIADQPQSHRCRLFTHLCSQLYRPNLKSWHRTPNVGESASSSYPNLFCTPTHSAAAPSC